MKKKSILKAKYGVLYIDPKEMFEQSDVVELIRRLDNSETCKKVRQYNSIKQKNL